MQFSFQYFLPFLSKEVISGILKQDGNKDYLKELLMFAGRLNYYLI